MYETTTALSQGVYTGFRWGNRTKLSWKTENCMIVHCFNVVTGGK
jgi:hypothetical protein